MRIPFQVSMQIIRHRGTAQHCRIVFTIWGSKAQPNDVLFAPTALAPDADDSAKRRALGISVASIGYDRDY